MFAAGKRMRLSQLPGVRMFIVMSAGAVTVMAIGKEREGALEPSRAVNPEDKNNKVPRTTPWES